jgi:PAS domain S-box-containing protein
MMINAEHLKEVNAELKQSLSVNYQKKHQIEEQLQKIQASELELKKLSLIATKTQIGVIVTDHQGNIEWVNEAFTHTSGYGLPEIIGKKPKDFLQRGNDQHDPVHDKLSKALAQKENVQVTLLNYTKEGKPYYNQLDITPVFNDLGQHVNFIALQKDITKEREQQEELLRINTRFDRITERSSIGIWEWDAVLNRVNWNDVLIRQYGAQRRDITTDFFTFWKACLHPEDRSFVEERSNQLVAGNGEILEDEYRICRRNDGVVRILKCMTLAERDEKGSIKRLMEVPLM